MTMARLGFSRIAPTTSPYLLRALIADWEPPAKPHCSNCSNCIVGGAPDEPTAHCAQGRGNVITLVQLLRKKAPRQFVPAVKCPDWDDMGGPLNVHRP